VELLQFKNNMIVATTLPLLTKIILLSKLWLLLVLRRSLVLMAPMTTELQAKSMKITQEVLKIYLPSIVRETSYPQQALIRLRSLILEEPHTTKIISRTSYLRWTLL